MGFLAFQVKVIHVYKIIEYHDTVVSKNLFPKVVKESFSFWFFKIYQVLYIPSLKNPSNFL